MRTFATRFSKVVTQAAVAVAMLMPKPTST